LNYKARFDGVDAAVAVAELLRRLDPAELNLPRDITLASASQ
jgi:hypothetical protein